MTDIGHSFESSHSVGSPDYLSSDDSFFHQLVVDTSDSIITADSDGTIVFANPAVESLFGYSQSELVGKLLTILVPDRYHEQHESGYEEYVAQNNAETEAESVDIWGVDSEGEEIPLSVTFHDHTYDGRQLFTAIIRDISEQEQTERSLREERELVQQVFETSPIALAVQSTDGEVLRANSRALEMLGLEDDDQFSPLDERADWQVYGPDGEPLSPDEYVTSRVIQTEEPVYNFEIAIERPSIGRRWFTVNGAPLFDEDGELEQVVLTGEDITELKDQQRELEQRRKALETELEEIFNRVTDAFFAIDKNSRFTYVNSHAESVFGRRRADLVGKNLWEAFPEMESYREQYEEALETQEPVFFEAYSDPLSTWFDVRLYPSETGLSVYFRDISARKEREHELEQAETMLETVEDGVYVLDEELRLVAVNDALASITGYSEDTLLGASASLLTDEESLEVGREMQEELREGERDAATIETEFKCSDGSQVPVEVRFAPLAIEDEFRGTVGVVRDITERKEREEALQQQNERLDTFASALAHELRNPLSIAQGYLDIAWSNQDDVAFEEVDMALDRIENVLDSLLFISRGGGSVDTTTSIDLRETAEEAWSAVDTANAALNIESTREVTADRDHLGLLFENLFRNSVEHGGDDVTVRVGVLPDGFYVEDDGPGISKETRKHVFEPGYSTSKVGMGVGLTLTRQLSKAYGWECTATEGRDGGARFEFTDVL
ncbi:PAS domain S-box protein [Haladaptatus sp. NG-SE-30]